jgi:hypothetical protein
MLKIQLIINRYFLTKSFFRFLALEAAICVTFLSMVSICCGFSH